MEDNEILNWKYVRKENCWYLRSKCLCICIFLDIYLSYTRRSQGHAFLKIITIITEGGRDEDRMMGLEKKECTPGRNNGNK